MIRRLMILALMCALPMINVGAQASDEAQIRQLLDDMTAAVLDQDQALYLSHVDLSEPHFALEHTRWSDEWASERIIKKFSLSARDILVEGDEATAMLAMRWQTRDNPDRWEADYPVVFRRGEDGDWRYAGEQWVTFESEHFEVLAMPGLEETAQALLPSLPAIYDYVTTSMDYAPAERNVIKLYNSSEALVATTLLSLPIIQGWNEPGESLKLFAEEGYIAEGGLAHEFTHFITFEMAGTAHSRMPWWLEEGLAQYNGSYFWGEQGADDYLAITQDAAAHGGLVEWELMSVFEATPVDLWYAVYPQGYAFARYVTETYGIEQRNAWIKAMAVEMDIYEASEAVLGKPFDELDGEFQEWLAG
jgi:ketosteroid isomerase-like protein